MVCMAMVTTPCLPTLSEVLASSMLVVVTLSNTSPLARGVPMLSLLSRTTATHMLLVMLLFQAQLMGSTRHTQELVTPSNMCPGLTLGEDKPGNQNDPTISTNNNLQ